MLSPFPGMDPYLEQFWGDVHHTLINRSRAAIQKHLPDDLVACVDDLQAILNECCEEGRYVDDIDYREEPDPPLGPGDARWADALFKEQGYR